MLSTISSWHRALGLLSCAVLLSSASAQVQQPLIHADGNIKNIPSVGLGLWNSRGKSATTAVLTGFNVGYNHIDSAAAYSNEDLVGKALTDKAAPKRSSYWITSKLWNTMHNPNNVPKAFNKTLSDLGTDYLDLYLMHWPVAFLPEKPGRNIIDQDVAIVDTWRAMQKLVSKNRTHPEKGTTRFIGISNFSPRQIDEILTDKESTIKPYAHEFETHPWLQQQDFVTWHHQNKIHVIAYSPLANLNPNYKEKHPELPRIIDDPFFLKLAKSKNATAAQTILAWNLARNVTIIPKSVHEGYIRENYEARHVELSGDDLKDIAAQDKKVRFNNPGKGWGVDLFEGLDANK